MTGPDSVLSPEQREKVDSYRAKLTQGAGALTEEERGELKDSLQGLFLNQLFEQEIQIQSERAKMASGHRTVFQNRRILPDTKPGDPPADPAGAGNPPGPPKPS